jgi:hypothetical protein
MTETRKAILAALFVISTTVWTVLRLVRHRKATRLAACRWRDRPPMDDDDFLKGCEIPDEPLRIEVALAARRVIAELGTVPPETIRPDDSFARELVQLPFWDSLDWLDLVLLIEEKLGGRVIFPEPYLDDAVRAARGELSDIRVKHVVRSLALAATDRPKKILLDEDW